MEPSKKQSMKQAILYLASQSSRRKEILKNLGIPFKVIRSDYRETARGSRGLSPENLAIQHATGKVKKAKIPKGARLVLGADTIVYHNTENFRKTENKKRSGSACFKGYRIPGTRFIPLLRFAIARITRLLSLLHDQP